MLNGRPQETWYWSLLQSLSWWKRGPAFYPLESVWEFAWPVWMCYVTTSPSVLWGCKASCSVTLGITSLSFCGWCGSSSFIMKWPLASTGSLGNWVWSSRKENQHLRAWGHASYVPLHTSCGLVTERMRSRIPAAEMSFLCRVAGLSCRESIKKLSH